MAETLHGDRGRAPEAQEHILEVTPSKVKGHPGVKLLRNALWLPNLMRRIPNQTVMHCWGQRSCRGQLGSSRGQVALEILYGHQILWEEELTKV